MWVEPKVPDSLTYFVWVLQINSAEKREIERYLVEKNL